MANRWGVSGNRLYLGGSKITTDGDCSHEIKRRLLLERKAMTNLESILKSRDITLLTIVCLVKAMVFPVVMYGFESWTIKKAERWRTGAFELCCWRRLESLLDCKEIQTVHPKGRHSWIFIRRTDAEAETPLFWPPDTKMEKDVANHSSTLAWKIPQTEEPGKVTVHGFVQSRTWLSDFTFTFKHWRRKRQPTPVFLPEEFQGQRNLVGCCLWGRTDLDTTEVT